jgi:hypothetical protein
MSIKPIGEDHVRLDWNNALADTANANQSKLIEENKREQEKNAAKKNYDKWFFKSSITSLANNQELLV